MFKLRTPPVTLGYVKPPISSGKPSDAILLGIDKTTTDTLIHLFITLEPSLPQPGRLKLRFQSAEEDRLLKYTAKWVSRLTSERSPAHGRIVLGTTLDLEGKTTLITRFIRPQNPPMGVVGTRLEKILRFVSRIPYVQSRVMLSADANLWCTTEQLLEIGAGDGVEHAILLCNLIMGMTAFNKPAVVNNASTDASSAATQNTGTSNSISNLLNRNKGASSASLNRNNNSNNNGRLVCVVLGRGFPEGNTAYVMLRETLRAPIKDKPKNETLTGSSDPDSLAAIITSGSGNKSAEAELSSSMTLTLFNPLTGEYYGAGDPHIPLKEVGCVFNDDNVWCNIQKKANPGNLSWDLTDTKCWCPLFDGRFQKPELPSIQVK